MATLRCTNCGKLFPSERCPRCGSEQGIGMNAERGEFTLTAHPPTIIILGADKATGVGRAGERRVV